MGMMSNILRKITRSRPVRRAMTSKQVVAYRQRATKEAAVEGVEKYHDREGKEEARIAYAETKREARIEAAKAKAKADAARPSMAHRIGVRLMEGPRQPRFAPKSAYRSSRNRGMYPPPPATPKWGFEPASLERKKRKERNKWGF